MKLNFNIYFSKNINLKKMHKTEDLSNSIMTIRYKLVFVGDVSVGKTSIVNRFITNNFSNDYDVKN